MSPVSRTPLEAYALRSQADRADALADHFLAWSAEAFASGHAVLGQACSDHAAGFVKRASILREEAAWLESRWPDRQSAKREAA